MQFHRRQPVGSRNLTPKRTAVPCRTGTRQMHGILEKITAGRATPADLQMLEELCDLVLNTSLCGLGQSAPNPVLSTLRYFRDEYLALLKDAPAGTA